MEEFLKSFGQYGFPIALCTYLMVRWEPLVRDLRDSIRELRFLIEEKSKNGQL